ncbi:MAG: CRISPR-associated endonuclease Cas2 [Solobacterium sp.]|nr:CRISPR-associated endonuclease Cas2 [Solobacterium sp.]
MFVIVSYDVCKIHAAKALKTCRKYLTHVQESVFEGSLSEAQLKRMMKELDGILSPTDDACTIYVMESTRFCTKQSIGKVTSAAETVIESRKDEPE